MYRQAKALFVVSALTLGISQAYAVTEDVDFIVTTTNPNAAAVFTGNATNANTGLNEPALLMYESQTIEFEGDTYDYRNNSTHTASGSTYAEGLLNESDDYRTTISSRGHNISTTDGGGIRSSAIQDANGITYTRTDTTAPEGTDGASIDDAGYYRSGFFVGDVSTDGDTLYAPTLSAGEVLSEVVVADTVASNVSVSDSTITNQVYAGGVTANNAEIGNVAADNVSAGTVIAGNVIATTANLAEVNSARVVLSADAQNNNEAVRLGQLTSVIDAKLQAAQLPSNQTITALQNGVDTLNTTVLALGNSVEQLDAKLDHSVRSLEKEHNVAMAKQAALNGLFQPYSVGKANVSVALGGYGSDTAVAVGAGYRLNEHLAGKAGVALASGNKKTAYNVAVNYEF